MAYVAASTDHSLHAAELCVVINVAAMALAIASNNGFIEVKPAAKEDCPSLGCVTSPSNHIGF